MGVLGLTYLLKSDERFKDTESLVSLVENHRTSTKTRPLIIIDGRSIYNQIFGKSYPVLFDYAQVHQNLSKLSTLLTSLDVDVEVFFPRGRQDQENILNNAQTQAQRVIYHMRLIHELKPLQFIYKLPGWSYRDVVRFIFGFYFQVVNSMTYCENDIVRYAHSRNCLAIITRELNLVCCDLSIQYWYYESLNYSERTVILFNIRGFADHFNFNVNHMLFVLASFGNRVLTARQMAVTYGNPLEFKIRLDRVTAGLSSRRSLALNELRESPYFEALLDEMFPKAAGTILLYQDFARSLAIYEECYCTNLIEQDNILMYVKALVEQNKIQPSFFYLLKERKFYNVHGFQCLSNRKFQYGRVMEVYADLRKRIYYLLFRDIHCTVQEYWVKDNLENKTTEIETKEINPESAEFGNYFIAMVVNSMTYCENDIVRYAHSRNCLAIITRELNLVCCDLSIQYWYYESLNYSERTVILFNIRGFADHFNFNVNHMLFVLASFGNRVLTARQMAVTYGNPLEFKIRLDRVTAGLSSRRSLALNELRESPYFEALLDEMFPKAAGTILLYQDFARSLAIYEECYCTNLIEQDNILMYVKALVEQNKIQPSFFYLLKERKFYNVHGFQCLSNRKFQYGRVMEVYADLRKRIYYLLFRDIHCTVQEYWVKDNLENKTTEIETKEINPESAEFEINLSLLELMQNEDDQIRDLKWRILVHSVSSAIDIDQFRHLSPKYYYPVLTLHYLLNLPGERVIEKWEADVFLCHLELENKVPYIVGYNGRALELINIYNSGLTFICYLVAASGFPISIRTLMESNSPEWHFNGEAFYSAYCYLEHRVRDIITDDMSTEPRQLLGLI